MQLFDGLLERFHVRWERAQQAVALVPKREEFLTNHPKRVATPRKNSGFLFQRHRHRPVWEGRNRNGETSPFDVMQGEFQFSEGGRRQIAHTNDWVKLGEEVALLKLLPEPYRFQIEEGDSP